MNECQMENELRQARFAYYDALEKFVKQAPKLFAGDDVISRHIEEEAMTLIVYVSLHLPVPYENLLKSTTEFLQGCLGMHHLNVPKNEISKKDIQRKIEIQRIAEQNKRADKLGLPATLTLEGWLKTLDYFHWKCAYCRGRFEVLEHFIPIVQYGGTTADNCVPACRSCNRIKGGWHPNRAPYSAYKHNEVMQQGIVRVQEYLQGIERMREGMK